MKLVEWHPHPAAANSAVVMVFEHDGHTYEHAARISHVERKVAVADGALLLEARWHVAKAVREAAQHFGLPVDTAHISLQLAEYGKVVEALAS